MDYHELTFFQKARKVTQEINNELRAWTKAMQAQEIARQVFRATTSIGANIAEGHGRHIGPEYIHFLTIAQGSANEVDYWLNTALDCGIGNQENIRRIMALNLETLKMLSATINSLRNHRINAMHETPAPYSPTPFGDDENKMGEDMP
jgi:four helix bundle protein